MSGYNKAIGPCTAHVACCGVLVPELSRDSILSSTVFSWLFSLGRVLSTAMLGMLGTIPPISVDTKISLHRIHYIESYNGGKNGSAWVGGGWMRGEWDRLCEVDRRGVVEVHVYAYASQLRRELEEE